MLLGLPVDGKAVNGSVQQPNSLCEELLGGDMVEGGDARGQGILLTKLKNHYATLELNENSSELAKIIKPRTYIMILFGTFLFPESTGNSVNFMYLNLLRDFEKTRKYSWGSAVLAHLYSSLCKNAIKEKYTFYGCAFLLQAWGWLRMESLNPVNNNTSIFTYATK